MAGLSFFEGGAPASDPRLRPSQRFFSFTDGRDVAGCAPPPVSFVSARGQAVEILFKSGVPKRESDSVPFVPSRPTSYEQRGQWKLPRIFGEAAAFLKARALEGPSLMGGC